ncbi:ABC transporter permease [Cupriavidus basilensis]
MAEVILADAEPTGALDSHSGQEVLAILRELHALGHTVIIVTHDMALARNAGRIIEIADGRIVADRANRPAPAPAAGQVNAPPSPAPGQVANGGGDAPPRRARAWHGFTEAFAMAWGALMAHRMRTALTMLGIIIGIASVVSIVAIGEGAKRYVMNDIRATGANTLEIFPGADFGDDRCGHPHPGGKRHRRLARAAPWTTPVTSKVQRQSTATPTSMPPCTAWARAFRRCGLGMTQGAPFRPDEVRQHAQVVVIGRKRRAVFGDVTPVLGKIVLVGSLPCVVIGVAREKRKHVRRQRQQPRQSGALTHPRLAAACWPGAFRREVSCVSAKASQRGGTASAC